MKKLISFFYKFISTLYLFLLLVLASQIQKVRKKKNVTVKVASHTAPMTDMLEMIKDDLQKEGYNLEIVKSF